MPKKYTPATKQLSREWMKASNPARDERTAEVKSRSLVIAEMALRSAQNARGDKPAAAARRALKDLGWTAKQIKEAISRYEKETPRLDWLPDPFVRDLVRTAVGEKTGLWVQAQLAAHERQSEAARARTKQRHAEENPDIDQRNSGIRAKAQRLRENGWKKDEILDDLEGDEHGLVRPTLSRIAFGDE